MAQGPKDRIGLTPRPLMVLRVLGLGSLLGFPVAIALVSRLRYPASAYVLFCPGMVLLGFICLGAGFRAAGGVYRGALVGAALYVLPGAAFDAYIAVFKPAFRLDLFTIVYWGATWPLYGYLWLLQFFGVTSF